MLVPSDWRGKAARVLAIVAVTNGAEDADVAQPIRVVLQRQPALTDRSPVEPDGPGARVDIIRDLGIRASR